MNDDKHNFQAADELAPKIETLKMQQLDPNLDDNVAKVTLDLEKLVEENGIYKQSLQIKARAVPNFIFFQHFFSLLDSW